MTVKTNPIQPCHPETKPRNTIGQDQPTRQTRFIPACAGQCRADSSGSDHPGGFIPANAGLIGDRRSIPSSPWSHPRTRGAMTPLDPSVTSVSESSPHTRGQCAHRLDEEKRVRVIPASAGPILSDRIHPRMRGGCRISRSLCNYTPNGSHPGCPNACTLARREMYASVLSGGDAGPVHRLGPYVSVADVAGL